MIDPIATKAAAPTNTLRGADSDPELDREAAWKQEFRDTMSLIREGGFDAYAEEINEEKMEEIREKILGEMGLNEEKLEAMPADQRAEIEKMVAREIRQRLAAEREIDATNDGVRTPGTGTDGLMPTQSVADGLANGQMMIEIMEHADRVGGPGRQEIPGEGKGFPFAVGAKGIDRDGESQ